MTLPTRLISDLLQSGVVTDRLRDLSSQAELLRLYWDHRIAGQGAAAQACLFDVVGSMVDIRALRVPTSVAAGTYPPALDALCLQGVLIQVENGRYVQFRHHLLFDYVASRLLLDMDGIVSGRSRFPKAEAKGLMLAPALGFLLQELWVSARDRGRYWTAVEQIIGDNSGDPMLRSVAARLSSELPETPADTQTLAGHVRSGDDNALTVLGHVTAALAVRLEDETNVSLLPWIALAGSLAGNTHPIPPVLRFLVHLLLNVVKPPQLTSEVGLAARALLREAFDHDLPGAGAASLIPFVVTTFATDTAASRSLLETIFDRHRFTGHAWKDVPALCREIGKLAAAAPDFAAEVYAFTFAGSADCDVVTRFGDSKIMSLTSTAKQDYDSALYSLTEFFPTFLTQTPIEASSSFVRSVDAYIARAHPPEEGETRETITATVADRAVQFKPDLSHIWAHDPDDQYAQDGKSLVAKFTTTMVSLPEDRALAIADQLVSTASSAIIWSRLFLVAARRRDGLVDLLWPFAAHEPWRVHDDTRKDAADVIAAGYARRSTAEREALERAAFAFDTTDFIDPVAAKKGLLDRLFGAIAMSDLVTNEAKAHVAALPMERHTSNERPFQITTSWGTAGRFDWIPELDRSLPSNSAMISAIELASGYFGLEPGQGSKSDIDTWQGFAVLAPVVDALVAPNLNDDLRRQGEGVIGEACVRLATDQHLVAVPGHPDPAQPFSCFFRILANSDGPSVEPDTEQRFEKFASWGSPSPRVEASQAALDACLQRPDLYRGLADDIDRLLADLHPAVRLQAASHLVRIWDIDRAGFWLRLSLRLEQESNFGVLTHVLDVLRRVLHLDPVQTEAHLVALLDRFNGTTRETQIAELTADLVAILAVTHSSQAAQTLLARWIDAPIAYKSLLQKIVVTLRVAVAIGLRSGEAEDTGLRHRAQSLLHRIVVAANGPLSGYDPKVVVSDDQVEGLRACLELLDIAGMELYFATGRMNDGAGGLTDAGCAIFLQEMAQTIERIGDSASPHTVYHLMQLLEILAPYGAATVFDLTAHAIRNGGRLGGFFSSGCRCQVPFAGSKGRRPLAGVQGAGPLRPSRIASPLIFMPPSSHPCLCPGSWFFSGSALRRCRRAAP